MRAQRCYFSHFCFVSPRPSRNFPGLTLTTQGVPALKCLATNCSILLGGVGGTRSKMKVDGSRKPARLIDLQKSLYPNASIPVSWTLVRPTLPTLMYFLIFLLCCLHQTPELPFLSTSKYQASISDTPCQSTVYCSRNRPADKAGWAPGMPP